MYNADFLEPIPAEIKQSFAPLPEDPNMQTGDHFRFRAFITGKIIDHQFLMSDHIEVFTQSKEVNSYQGGIKRQFALMPRATGEFIAQKLIMEKLYKHLPQIDYHCGIHQIRIIASDTAMGKPAPEGVHQDGFDYVCTFCVSLANVAGGNSILVDAAKRDKFVYEHILAEGEMILFDDRKYAHYASPIVPKLPGRAARDVFVVTFQKLVR